MDYTAMSEEELRAAQHEISIELERRRNENELPQRIEKLAGLYQQAIGRVEGDQWVQPTGAHDAYRQDATVAHNGKIWRSTTPANVWEPGVSGWREESSPDPETGEVTVPDFVQPTGGHDAYNTGDRVTFEGAVYESIIDGNVWSPTAHPLGWKKIEAS